MGAQPHKDIQYLVPSEYGSEYLESQFLTRQMWDIDDACKLITIGYPYNFEFLHDQQDRKRKKFEESERKFDSIQDWRELSDDNLQSQWEELERSQHKLVMMEIVYDRCKRKSMESVKHGEIKERDTKENWLKWAKLNGYKIGHLELATTDTGTADTGTTPEEAPAPPAPPMPKESGNLTTERNARLQGKAENVEADLKEAKNGPGRRKNVDYAAIEGELRRRAEAGEMLMMLKTEMCQLETWAKEWAEKQNPSCKSSAAGNIGKHFRELYRTLKSAEIEKQKAD